MLISIIVLQEILQRVTQGLVELSGLCSKFILQTCLKLLKIVLLALNGILYAGGLLTALETVVIQLLLEVVNSCLKGITLLGKRIAGIVRFFCRVTL